MPKLSVLVITHNEEANIAAALTSVAWADEIVVVDAESTDRTVEIARQFTERIVVRAWKGFVDQKNFAATLASNDWVLSLDADERVTPTLAAAIQQTLTSDPAHAGFRVSRVTSYLGRWIRSTDWFPDRHVRLFDRRRARWSGRLVHESLEVDGPVGALDGELHHLPYRDIADHLETIDRYTTLAARHPPLAFLRNYIARGGFRDGRQGLIVSSMNAYYVFLKFAKLWELQRSGPADPSASR